MEKEFNSSIAVIMCENCYTESPISEWKVGLKGEKLARLCPKCGFEQEIN